MAIAAAKEAVELKSYIEIIWKSTYTVTSILPSSGALLVRLSETAILRKTYFMSHAFCTLYRLERWESRKLRKRHIIEIRKIPVGILRPSRYGIFDFWRYYTYVNSPFSVSPWYPRGIHGIVAF